MNLIITKQNFNAYFLLKNDLKDQGLKDSSSAL